MSEAIAIRIEEELLKKIDLLTKKEESDRSTVVRGLIQRGYREIIKEKAVEEYKMEKITLSEAAHRAGLTVFEMERYLVEKGFMSQYTIDDLEREIKMIEKRGR